MFVIDIKSVVEIAVVVELPCYFNSIFGILQSVMLCYNNKKDLQLERLVKDVHTICLWHVTREAAFLH